MKIETEIPDISRDDIIEAMARQLLRRYDDDDGDVESRFGAAMRKYLEARVSDLAQDLVRQRFTSSVAQRIEAAIDAVLAEGWERTDSYGNRTGQKMDLKGRISEVLNARQGDSYNRRGTLIEETIKTKLAEALANDFGAELKDAREKFRAQIDGAVSAKLVESLKSALGLR